jgi:hypothetical protein
LKPSTYTPSRQRRGESSAAVVRSFMAHHQAMIRCRTPMYYWRDRCKTLRVDPFFKRRCFFFKSASQEPHCFTECTRSFRPAPGGAVTVRVLTSPDTRFRRCRCCRTGRYHGWSRMPEAEQSLERSSGPAGAEDAPPDNCDSATSATRRGEFCQPHISPHLQAEHRSDILRGACEFREEISISRRIPRSWFLQKMILNCVGPHHQPVLEPRTIDVTSYESCSRQRPQTHCIQRSVICSCKPRSSARATFAPVAHALRRTVPWMFHLMTARSGSH